MLREVVRRFRHAVPAQIGRRGANDLPGRRKPRDDHRGGLLLVPADRDVVLGQRRIDRVVRQIELHLDMAMALEEIGQHRNELVQADDDRARDLQHALRLAAIFAGDQFGLRDVSEDAHAALVERFAGIGQRDAARGAVEQPHAQPLLQPIDPPAHGGARHIERLCGRREARVVDDAGEDADFILACHGAAPDC